MTSGNREQTVGIVGGMGPEATVELMKRIIEGTPAADDCDHIHMLVDNNPKVPSRIKAILEGGGEDPVPALVTMVTGLQASGADYLVMPCNTAHYYYDKMQAAVDIPFWNIIELTKARLATLDPVPRKIGMLASTAIQKIGLYEGYFTAGHADILYPDAIHQEQVMSIIRAVKADAVSAELIEGYQRAIAHLEAQGADVLVLACTELSTLDSIVTSVPVIDTLQVLADEIIATAHPG